VTYIAIVEPGTNHLLLRLDAERAIIEIVRRRHKTVIDLTEYGLEYKAPQGMESREAHGRIASGDDKVTAKIQAVVVNERGTEQRNNA